jgi:hypothetical protein
VIAIGVVLIVAGLVAGYIDSTTRFKSELIDEHFRSMLVGLFVGVTLVFVGAIGWAWRREPSAKIHAAGTVFFTPWLGVVAGYFIDGMNIHGGSALMIALIPAAVVLIMAGF